MEPITRTSAVVLCLLLPSVLLNGVAAAVHWEDIPKLLSGSPEEYRSIVLPLGSLTKLSYTATYGGYSKLEETNGTLKGWEKINKLVANPKTGGMRGLVFEAEEAGPVVVAFRGTDLTLNNQGSLLDVCFDAKVTQTPMPDFCGNFTKMDIDYLQQAEQLMDKTLKEYPKRQVVTTGHSSGCALAAAMAVKMKSKGVSAVCFALPGVLDAVSQESGEDKDEIRKSKNVHSLAISEDPIVKAGVLDESLFGQLYVWTAVEVPECTECCEETRGQSVLNLLLNGNCTQCFGKAHRFSSYSKLIATNLQPQKVIISAPNLNCTSVFADKIQRHETKQTTLDKLLSKRMGSLGMSILLVVVSITAICSVGLALMSYFGKGNKKSARFMELEGRS